MKEGTTKHPKMLMLAEELGGVLPDVPLWIRQDIAVATLTKLWEWAGQFAPAGDVGRWSDEAIAQGCGFGADAAGLIAALVRTRWLDPHEQFRLVVHDWSEHCESQVHVRLAARAQLFYDGVRPSRLERLHSTTRQRYLAQYSEPEQAPEESAGKAPGKRRENARNLLGQPIANNQLPIANSQLPIANSQDGEKMGNTSLWPDEAGVGSLERVGGSAPPSGDSPGSNGAPFSMPLRNGRTFAVPAEKVAEWTVAYPGVDVPSELRRACQWARDNPGRRKTSTGALDFFSSWLNRESRKNAKPKQNYAVEQPYADDDPFKPD